MKRGRESARFPLSERLRAAAAALAPSRVAVYTLSFDPRVACIACLCESLPTGSRPSSHRRPLRQASEVLLLLTASSHTLTHSHCLRARLRTAPAFSESSCPPARSTASLTVRRGGKTD